MRAVPDPDKGVLGHILGVLGVFQVGQGQSVHRRPGAVVQPGQGLTVAGRHSGQQLLQLPFLLFAPMFRCLNSQKDQHGHFSCHLSNAPERNFIA